MTTEEQIRHALALFAKHDAEEAALIQYEREAQAGTRYRSSHESALAWFAHDRIEREIIEALGSLPPAICEALRTGEDDVAVLVTRV